MIPAPLNQYSCGSAQSRRCRTWGLRRRSPAGVWRSRYRGCTRRVRCAAGNEVFTLVGEL